MPVEDSTVHVGSACTGSGGNGSLWRAMIVEARVRAVAKAKVDRNANWEVTRQFVEEAMHRKEGQAFKKATEERLCERAEMEAAWQAVEEARREVAFA